MVCGLNLDSRARGAYARKGPVAAVCLGDMQAWVESGAVDLTYPLKKQWKKLSFGQI